MNDSFGYFNFNFNFKTDKNVFGPCLILKSILEWINFEEYFRSF